MEQEPGQDPEHDGPAGPQPPPGSSHPGDAGSPGPGASGSGSSGADADADAGAGGEAMAMARAFSARGRGWRARSGRRGSGRSCWRGSPRAACGTSTRRARSWPPPSPGRPARTGGARSATGEELIGLLRGDGGAAVVGGRGDAGDDPGADPRRRPAVPGPLRGTGTCPMSGTTPWSTRSPWRWRCRRRRRTGRPGPRGSWAPACPGSSCCCGTGRWTCRGPGWSPRCSRSCRTRTAARAEELLLPELTAPPRKTYTQVERIATAIAAAVDPGLAERRRKAAEKHRSRVTMFRERAGHGRAVGPGPAGRRDAGRLRATSTPAPGCTRTPGAFPGRADRPAAGDGLPGHPQRHLR